MIWHMCSSADRRPEYWKDHRQERSLRFVLKDFTSEHGVLLEKSSKSTLYLGRFNRWDGYVWKLIRPQMVWPRFLCRTYFKGKHGYIHVAYATQIPCHCTNSEPYNMESFHYDINKTWKGPLCKCGTCMHTVCILCILYAHCIHITSIVSRQCRPMSHFSPSLHGLKKKKKKKLRVCLCYYYLCTIYFILLACSRTFVRL